MGLRLALFGSILALAACGTRIENPPPLVTTPPGEVKGAPVARIPVEKSLVVPPATATAPAPFKPTVPPGAIYVCVINATGAAQQTAIEFAPKVGALCAKHPEMGPCQYERNQCRASGGRVFAANGAEITMQTEAEYDKKVMRTRFKSN